jgi:gamma-glutamyltranspeptidase/glutathione hydrolase
LKIRPVDFGRTYEGGFSVDDNRRAFLKQIASLPAVGCTPIALGASVAFNLFSTTSSTDEAQKLPPETTKEVTSTSAMVVGTTGKEAAAIGGELLKRRGNAMDAAIATAMAQVVLSAGSWVSFAGISQILHYSAATGKVYNINGGFNTVRQESDYQGVPSINLGALVKSEHPGHFNGRTVMVPGFMRGIEAAHRKFGKLKWAELIQPSIDLAERGFVVSKGLASQFEFRKQVLSRFPESKAVVFKDDDTTYQEGDWFKQPALARTLREVARRGADYMYTGAWAKKFVKAVRAIGGRITLEDMADYEALWVEPVRGSYEGYDLVAPGLPSYGGVNLIEAMQMIEAAGLGDKGSYANSAETLYWLSHITRNAANRVFSGTPEEVAKFMYQRLTKEHARKLWEKIKADGGFYDSLENYTPRHSDAVVTIDADDDMVAMMHSINTVTFGETGLIVDGISVSDALTNQLDVARATKPGSRLPDPGEPVFVLKKGRPYGTFSAIGAGLHQRLVCVLFEVLEFGLTPQQALNQPSLGFTIRFWWVGKHSQNVGSGQFNPELVEQVKEMGLHLIDNPPYSGYVVGITIDPRRRLLHGGIVENFGGRAVGF